MSPLTSNKSALINGSDELKSTAGIVTAHVRVKYNQNARERFRNMLTCLIVNIDFDEMK